jgi:hypothetical protein
VVGTAVGVKDVLGIAVEGITDGAKDIDGYAVEDKPLVTHVTP